MLLPNYGNGKGKRIVLTKNRLGVKVHCHKARGVNELFDPQLPGCQD